MNENVQEIVSPEKVLLYPSIMPIVVDQARLIDPDDRLLVFDGVVYSQPQQKQTTLDQNLSSGLIPIAIDPGSDSITYQSTLRDDDSSLRFQQISDNICISQSTVETRQEIEDIFNRRLRRRNRWGLRIRRVDLDVPCANIEFDFDLSRYPTTEDILSEHGEDYVIPNSVMTQEKIKAWLSATYTLMSQKGFDVSYNARRGVFVINRLSEDEIKYSLIEFKEFVDTLGNRYDDLPDSGITFLNSTYALFVSQRVIRTPLGDIPNDPRR